MQASPVRGGLLLAVASLDRVAAALATLMGELVEGMCFFLAERTQPELSGLRANAIVFVFCQSNHLLG